MRFLSRLWHTIFLDGNLIIISPNVSNDSNCYTGVRFCSLQYINFNLSVPVFFEMHQSTFTIMIPRRRMPNDLLQAPLSQFIYISGHDGSIPNADLCRSIKIKIQELIQNTLVKESLDLCLVGAVVTGFTGDPAPLDNIVAGYPQG